ncbi:hypothetical protein NLU13_3215 [Sarocladium strictum]|uniref:GRF-type domain-containing protein n=1 Tax=Sarocladium strictum TaxID=5046 RepID=A0AA39GLL2_SARSR|nr:hypothetical protein NLU13_3215 [Sarocladium strictum]
MTEVPATTPAHCHDPDISNTSFKRLYGAYVDGKWWCNCQPNRKLAALREVTKDTPNKGKFFWTCPVFNGCNFFLFWDEARAREGGPHPTPLAQDLPPRPKTPTLTQPKLTAYGVQLTPGRRRQSRGEEVNEEHRETGGEATTTMAKRSCPSHDEMPSALRTPESGKRKRHDIAEPRRGKDDSTDEFSDFAVDSDDERQLIDLTDASAKKVAASKVKGGLVTPKTGTRTVAGLPTPSSVSRNLFPSDRSRPKSVTFDPATPSRLDVNRADEDADDDGDDTIIGDNTQADASFTSTATLPTTDSPSTISQSDPTSEILSILSSHGIDPSARRSVHHLLSISARRARGVEKSRDALREELRKQKSRNAKLQDKIAALEDKLKMRDRSVTNLKAGLMELYDEN